jgi:hypothetical protein
VSLGGDLDAAKEICLRDQVINHLEPVVLLRILALRLFDAIFVLFGRCAGQLFLFNESVPALFKIIATNGSAPPTRITVAMAPFVMSNVDGLRKSVFMMAIMAVAVANIRSPASAAMQARAMATAEMKMPSGIKIAKIAKTNAAIPKPVDMSASIQLSQW